MEDLYESLLFDEELSPEQWEDFQQRMEEDPELARAWTGWTQVRNRLRDRLQEHLTDRRLLVLYALERAGYESALTVEERRALEASRDRLARAIEAIPALEQVVERIQDERADFEALWGQHMETDDAEAPSSSASSREFRSDRSPRPSRSRENRRRRPWARRLALAFLLVGVGVLAVLFWPQKTSRTTVEVGDDEQKVVELEDGSTVRLSGAATLSYSPDALTSDRRHVTLEQGRAFFEVVPLDEETSFVVETPTARTTVVGTQFGVSTGADSTEVVLASGRVQVGTSDEADSETVALSPGERSLVEDGHPPTSPTPVDLTSALEWSGLFVFRSVSLDDITQRLSHHYDVSIAVAAGLQGERVTGTFDREQPVDQVLDALATTLGAEVRQDGRTYRLVVP